MISLGKYMSCQQQHTKVRVSIQQIMYSNTTNIFNKKPSPSPRNIFGPQRKVGSYRVQEGQQFFRLRPQDINECWADSPPLSFTTKQEVLHLSLTELRVEDYYLIRNELVTSQHQQMVDKAIQENAYNQMLNRLPCRFQYDIFNQPYDLEMIKMKKQIHNNKKSHMKTKFVDSPFQKNISNLLQNSRHRNSCSCSNIFGRNQTGLTQTNIFNRSTSRSSIYQPASSSDPLATNTSNNQYRPNSSSVNSQNSPIGNNVFAQNTPKDQPKNNVASNTQNNTANNQTNKNNKSSNVFSNPQTNTANNQTNPNIQGHKTSSTSQNNTANNQPKNNVSPPNVFNKPNNPPINTKSSTNNLSNSNTPNINNNNNIFKNNNTSNPNGSNIFNNSNNNTPAAPSCNNNIFNSSNNIFKNNNSPNIFNNNSSNNIFNNNSQLPHHNNLPYGGQNIFNRNIFQRQLCNNPSHYPQNIKKEIQISIKLSENNVVHQKIITTDNNIKIHLDCSHMMQPVSLRQHNPAFNSLIAARSDHPNKNTDRNKTEREREKQEKEKREVPVKRDGDIAIHNFENDEDIYEESRIRKCNYELKLYWLEEKREDRCISGSMKIDGFLPKDQQWRRKFINQLKKNHVNVRKDADLQQLVCKIDPRGYATITGTIIQHLINLPDYDVEYEKLTNGYAQGLMIANNNGSISWQQPVRLVEVDFQQLGFAISENQVMMPKNSPLNTACNVTFYRLPPRVEMLLEEDDYDGAFEKLTRIVEKGSQGTATLRILNQDFWKMHVTKFL